jgi:hypothetical protein
MFFINSDYMMKISGNINMAFIISSVSKLRKLPTFLVLASVLIFNGCNFEDLDDSEEPTGPETSVSTLNKNCEGFKTPGECRSNSSCQYFNSWRTPTKGKCLAKASANKLSCGKLTKDDCELNGLGTEKCVFAGICQPESGFSAKGFSKLNSFHLNGTKENDRGFNSAGLNVKTGSKYDALGMDIDGRNSRGFDAKGLLATGLDRDPRGFDAKGIHTNGTDRDDRHFDVKGLLVGGADRDARGFDAAGLLADGSDRDSRGFDAAGFHSNRTRRDDRGFDIQGRLLSGADRDIRGFNAQGLHTNGSDRDNRGFNREGLHTNGTNRDDRDFDLRGLLPNFALRDARGFDADGLLWDLSDRDNRGFNARGLHTNNTEWDDRGFNLAGRQRDGSDRDARGFDSAGFLPTGWTRDARGFDANGRQRDGSDRDSRGFNLQGLHTNNTDRDPRGFNVNGVLPGGALRDARGFNADGMHSNFTSRDARGFDVNGIHVNGSDRDDRGFDLQGRHSNNSDRDDRGFDIHGLLVGGLARDPRGFDADGFLPDGTDKDARGFKANRRLACGSLVDVNGFDVDGNHETTHGLHNPGGFDMRGIHQVTGDIFDAPAPGGRTIKGQNRLEAREDIVGIQCYIPGPADYLGRPDLRTIQHHPAGFADAEAFIQAIENRCQALNRPVPLAPGQSLADKRSRLIGAIKQANPLIRALGGEPADSLYTLERPNALKTYIGGLYSNGGLGKFSKTGRISYQIRDDAGNLVPEVGIDAGGLRRDFKDRVSQQIKPLFSEGTNGMEINSNFGAAPNEFALCATDAQVQNKENCWKNAGAVFAKLTIIEGEGVPHVRLSHSVIHGLLRTPLADPVDYLALLKLDKPDIFASQMSGVLNQNNAGIQALEMNFDDVGLADRDVDETNVIEYLQEFAKHSLIKSEQRWFVEGFEEVVSNLGAFPLNARTLALLLQGNPTSIDTIEAVLEVSDGFGQLKTWLLEIMREKMDADPNSSFLVDMLRFWTGSSAPPGEGGNSLRVNVYNNQPQDRLPVAHTCSLTIDVPPYATKELFKQKLIQAIEGAEGFGIH